MPRLTLAGILIAALFATLLSAAAQQARPYQIGVVLQGGPSFAAIDGLRDGLKDLGLEEGKHFLLHVRDLKGELRSIETEASKLEKEKGSSWNRVGDFRDIWG